MQIVKFHSHLNGYEWLLVHHPQVWKEINNVIKSIDAEKCKTKVSKEKTMVGKLLYSPEDLNASFSKGLSKLEWKESRTSYWVTDDYNLIRKTLHMAPKEQKAEIEAAGKKAIFSYNQTDFVRDRVAIEVQLGKYSFISYDLFVKHLAFYVGDQIDLGIEVLAMKSLQGQMSSGPGYYEGALYDLARQGRGVPAVPLILIGIA
ncbi:MAG: BglII/BstYI family type II restriction endonuclease [Candidatus Sulfotelmatobacter sp.]